MNTDFNWLWDQHKLTVLRIKYGWECERRGVDGGVRRKWSSWQRKEWGLTAIIICFQQPDFLTTSISIKHSFVTDSPYVGYDIWHPGICNAWCTEVDDRQNTEPNEHTKPRNTVGNYKLCLSQKTSCPLLNLNLWLFRPQIYWGRCALVKSDLL